MKKQFDEDLTFAFEEMQDVVLDDIGIQNIIDKNSKEIKLFNLLSELQIVLNNDFGYDVEGLSDDQVTNLSKICTSYWMYLSLKAIQLKFDSYIEYAYTKEEKDNCTYYQKYKMIKEGKYGRNKNYS